MKPIAFSGMLCYPNNLQKDGKFRIKGVISNYADNSEKNHPDIVRYENFASTEERDKRYNLIVNLLKVRV